MEEQECFLVIVRLCNGKTIGYPLKVFITNTTTVNMMVNHFTSKMDAELRLVSCLSKTKELTLNDIILDVNHGSNILKLLVRFK